MQTYIPPLGGPLLERVTQWAKAQGLAHELRMRARTLQRLKDAMASGKSYAEAGDLLESIEAEEATKTPGGAAISKTPSPLETPLFPTYGKISPCALNGDRVNTDATQKTRLL
jgi:hypothetical protein